MMRVLVLAPNSQGQVLIQAVSGEYVYLLYTVKLKR